MPAAGHRRGWLPSWLIHRPLGLRSLLCLEEFSLIRGTPPGGAARGGAGGFQVAQDERQPLLAGTDDDNLAVGGLGQLQGGVDALPLEKLLRDPLSDDVLEKL